MGSSPFGRILWCLWRSWLARQIVALEAESSNLSRHPTKDRTVIMLRGLFFCWAVAKR